MHKKYILLILTALIVGCENTPDMVNLKTLPNNLEAEEYAVYSTLINQMYNFDGIDRVVIGSQTSIQDSIAGNSNTTLQYVAKHLPRDSVSWETLNDFQAKNKQPQLLKPLFKIELKYVFLSKEEQGELFQTDNDWTAFLIKYPKQRLITLSRIGFNHEMNQAIVYIGSQSGPKSGSGFYVLLTKKDGIWSIYRKVEVWIS